MSLPPFSIYCVFCGRDHGVLEEDQCAQIIHCNGGKEYHLTKGDLDELVRLRFQSMIMRDRLKLHYKALSSAKDAPSQYEKATVCVRDAIVRLNFGIRIDPREEIEQTPLR